LPRGGYGAALLSRARGYLAMGLFRQLSKELRNLSTVEWLTLLITLFGLFADTVAILSYAGVVATPAQSPTTPTGNVRFLILVGFALAYSLGLVNSFLFRLWQRTSEGQRFQERSREAQQYRRRHISRGSLADSLTESEFVRRLLMAALTGFPFLFVYMRITFVNAQSETSALVQAAGAAIAAIPVIAVLGYAFDMIIVLAGSPN